MEDKGSSLQCRRCRKNIQESSSGIGVKRYLSAFDVVQGQGNGGVGQVRGGSAQTFIHDLPRVDEPVIARSWAQLEMGSGQNNGGILQPIAHALCNEPRIGKSWPNLELSTIQILGGTIQLSARGHSSEPVNIKNWAPQHGMDNGCINLESPRGQESPPSGILAHLQELESQVGRLKGEYTNQKKALSHLATFVQLSSSEIHNLYSKMKEHFDALARKIDNGCLCTRDIISQINSLHSSLKVVEAKLDGMRTDARITPPVFHGNNEENDGARNGNKENIGHHYAV